MLIPKIIHQVWIGPKNKPSYMSMWKDMNPDYEYILWDNDKIKEMFPLINQHLFDQFDKLEQDRWNGKTNIARAEILYKYGGIYMDADCYPLRPLEDFLLDCTFFVPFENEKRNKLVASGIEGSTPGHPILQKFIEELNKEKIVKLPSWIFCGPGFFSKIFESFKNTEGIKIVPSYYFLPHYYIRDFDYTGDFKPFCDHIWGTTLNKYS
jgi:inositol phosphorylceramide mannosyltransferase catalytic subunit